VAWKPQRTVGADKFPRHGDDHEIVGELAQLRRDAPGADEARDRRAGSTRPRPDSQKVTNARAHRRAIWA
jgi:hypothetical protein